MSDHIKALFEGQELTEEFKDKATAIFAAAVNEKTEEIREAVKAELQESQEAAISAKIQELDEAASSYIEEQVIPKVDQYLTAAVSEWLEENELVIESGSKVDLAESFLSGLVGLTESFGYQVPETQVDKVAELETALSEMKEQMNALKGQNIELKESARQAKRQIMLANLTESLTAVQLEKVQPIIEAVEYRTEEQFSEAITSVIKSYFPVVEQEDEEGVDDEEEKAKKKKLDESQDPYLSRLFGSLNG